MFKYERRGFCNSCANTLWINRNGLCEECYERSLMLCEVNDWRPCDLPPLAIESGLKELAP